MTAFSRLKVRFGRLFHLVALIILGSQIAMLLSTLLSFLCHIFLLILLKGFLARLGAEVISPAMVDRGCGRLLLVHLHAAQWIFRHLSIPLENFPLQRLFSICLERHTRSSSMDHPLCLAERRVQAFPGLKTKSFTMPSAYDSTLSN